MDWITEKIAIGNYLDAVDIRVVRQFQSVLGLVNTLPDVIRRDRSALTLLEDAFADLQRPSFHTGLDDLLRELSGKRIEVVELIDGPGNPAPLFRQAIALLAQLVQESAPVLVHCHAGRSRSPVIVAGYLMSSQGMDAVTALNYIDTRRSIFVHDALAAMLD